MSATTESSASASPSPPLPFVPPPARSSTPRAASPPASYPTLLSNTPPTSPSLPCGDAEESVPGLETSHKQAPSAVEYSLNHGLAGRHLKRGRLEAEELRIEHEDDKPEVRHSKGTSSIASPPARGIESGETEKRQLKRRKVETEAPTEGLCSRDVEPALVIPIPKEDLPTEILQHIFLEVVEITDDDRSNYTQDRYRQLNKMREVCRRWSAIILGSPFLWANVLDPREPSLTVFERVFALSGVSTPLEIYMEGVECALLETSQWRNIFEQIHRITRLDLGLVGKRTQEALKVLERALGMEAPMLECLCIAFGEDPEDEEEGSLSVSLTPAPNDRLFNGNAPKLKVLKFVDCAVVSIGPEPSGMLENLVVLEIKDLDFLELEFGLRWWDLCRSGWLPRLQHLGLGFLRRSIDPRPLPPSQDGGKCPRRGSLAPSLKLIRLFGDVEPCIALLDLMDVPTSCSVRLSLYADDPNRAEEGTVLESRTLSPQMEPAAVASSLSRLWREDIAPCLELRVTARRDGTLIFRHRSARRDVEATIQPAYLDDGEEETQAQEMLRFYRLFFGHLSQPEHLPALLADSEAVLTLDIALVDGISQVLESTFLRFLAQLKTVARLRLIESIPNFLIANGRIRNLVRVMPADIDGSPSSVNNISSDPLASLFLPAVTHIYYPFTFQSDKTLQRYLLEFVTKRVRASERFALIEEPPEVSFSAALE